MRKIGLSSCSKQIDSALFSAYRAAGVDAMEISERQAGYEMLDFKAVGKWAREYGVQLWSLHLPFSKTPLDISVDELAEGALSLFGELIRRGREIGVERFVVHPSSEPIPDGERDRRMKRARESLSRLAEIGAGEGAVLAVENLPRTCLGRDAAEMERLLDADPRLGLCFDTNHLLKEDFEPFLRRVGHRLLTVHVSDYDFVNERHWLPGEGRLDWARLLRVLDEVGYSGVWMYELGFACPKTILRHRDLTCEDFARNARELFSGVSPTVFSRPVPNLGFSNK